MKNKKTEHKYVLSFFDHGQEKDVKRLMVAVTAFMSLFADNKSKVGKKVISCIDILRGKRDDELFKG